MLVSLYPLCSVSAVMGTAVTPSSGWRCAGQRYWLPDSVVASTPALWRTLSALPTPAALLPSHTTTNSARECLTDEGMHACTVAHYQMLLIMQFGYVKNYVFFVPSLCCSILLRVFHSCSPRCNNSISILQRQEKAAQLETCQCDGSEPFDCAVIKSNMARLCFHKQDEGAREEGEEETNEIDTSRVGGKSGASLTGGRAYLHNCGSFFIILYSVIYLALVSHTFIDWYCKLFRCIIFFPRVFCNIYYCRCKYYLLQILKV